MEAMILEEVEFRFVVLRSFFINFVIRFYIHRFTYWYVLCTMQ